MKKFENHDYKVVTTWDTIVVAVVGDDVYMQDGAKPLPEKFAHLRPVKNHMVGWVYMPETKYTRSGLVPPDQQVSYEYRRDMQRVRDIVYDFAYFCRPKPNGPFPL